MLIQMQVKRCTSADTDGRSLGHWRLVLARLFWALALGGVLFGAELQLKESGLRLEIPAASAQELNEAEARRAKDLIRTTMSPFCPGLTLQACTSSYAGGWRTDIRQWVKAGVPSDEIRRRLKERMPEKDLTGTPSTVLDSVLPALATIAALVLLVLLLRKMLRPGEVSSRPDAGKPVKRESSLSEEELDKQLDAELATLDD